MIKKQDIQNLKLEDYPIGYLKQVNDFCLKSILNDLTRIAEYYELKKNKTPIDERLIEVLGTFADYIEVNRCIIDRQSEEIKFWFEDAKQEREQFQEFAKNSLKKD